MSEAQDNAPLLETPEELKRRPFRYYFREHKRTFILGLPFFFLPAVYKFSDRDIAKQFKFLLICTIIQLPVAVYQRFIESKGLLSGDAVRGTLNNSSTLSVFLVCAIALLLAFLYTGQLIHPLALRLL